MNGPGRRSKATPELLKEVTRLLEAGVPMTIAAEANAIARSTLHRWRNSKKLGGLLSQARARGFVNLHLKALAGGPGSHNALALLERLDPENYRPTQRLEHTGADGGPIATADDMSQYSDEELRRIIATGETDKRARAKARGLHVVTLESSS